MKKPMYVLNNYNNVCFKKLQTKNYFFQNQVKLLQNEKKQLINLNKILINKVNCLEEKLKASK